MQGAQCPGSWVVADTAPRWNWGWINPGLMLWAQWSPQLWQPQHVQHSCSVILRALCSPLTEIKAASRSLQHCPSTQQEGQEHLLVALEAFCLKMLGLFLWISEEGCPSCYCLCCPLASVLPTSQCRFSHLQLPSVLPSCKAKRGSHFYMDNQNMPVFVRVFVPFFPSLST